MIGNSDKESVDGGRGLMILTIGHSTLPIGDFVQLLIANGVKRLVDVRTVPRSRHNPQYNGETLPDVLAYEGIGYIHMAGLGGLRRARSDSPNMGWRNASFRGFADYMMTERFVESIGELISMGVNERLAVMCAEAVPWRCHRSLIADALLVRGARVTHIMGKGALANHVLTPFARVDGSLLTYPAADGE